MFGQDRNCKNVILQQKYKGAASDAILNCAKDMPIVVLIWIKLFLRMAKNFT